MGLDEMKRADGWEKRFHAMLDAKRGVVFEWGVNDCCTFTIENYRAIMGAEPAGVPRWSNEVEALELERQKPFEEWLTAVYGEPLEGYAWARRGDVVMVAADANSAPVASGLHAFGVAGGTMIVCLGLAGLAFVPLERGLKTWRIGE